MASVFGPYLIKVFVDDYLSPKLGTARDPVLGRALYHGSDRRELKLFHAGIALKPNRLERGPNHSGGGVRSCSKLPMAYFDHTPTEASSAVLRTTMEAITRPLCECHFYFYSKWYRVLNSEGCGPC